jgi:hypothetical protein
MTGPVAVVAVLLQRPPVQTPKLQVLPGSHWESCVHGITVQNFRTKLPEEKGKPQAPPLQSALVVHIRAAKALPSTKIRTENNKAVLNSQPIRDSTSRMISLRMCLIAPLSAV